MKYPERKFIALYIQYPYYNYYQINDLYNGKLAGDPTSERTHEKKSHIREYTTSKNVMCLSHAGQGWEETRGGDP